MCFDAKTLAPYFLKNIKRTDQAYTQEILVYSLFELATIKFNLQWQLGWEGDERKKSG